MRRDEVVRKLAAHRDEIEALGVAHLALFGSLARGEAADASDVDLIVEFSRSVGLFDFVRVKLYLERLLGAGVDLVMREALIDELRDDILKEAQIVA